MPDVDKDAARKDTGNTMFVDAVIALNQNVVTLPDRMAEKMASVMAEVRARPSEPPPVVVQHHWQWRDLLAVSVGSASMALFFFVCLYMMGARVEVRVVRTVPAPSGVAHAQAE